MISHARFRHCLAGSVAFAALAAGAAQAAGVNVSDASITGGKLVITGTASPNSWVRLDGQAGAAYNVKAGADGAFSLSVVYHPGDCVVELQNVVSPTTVGEASEALVANCGPAGLDATWCVERQGGLCHQRPRHLSRVRPSARSATTPAASQAHRRTGKCLRRRAPTVTARAMTAKAPTFRRPVRQAAI